MGLPLHLAGGRLVVASGSMNVNFKLRHSALRFIGRRVACGVRADGWGWGGRRRRKRNRLVVFTNVPLPQSGSDSAFIEAPSHTAHSGNATLAKIELQ